MAIARPTDIANCAIWLDGSDTATLSALSAIGLPGNFQISQTGDRIGYWGDKSGNNRHFTYVGQTTATRPTYISTLSAARFDGSTNFLTVSSFIPYTAESIFVVMSIRTRNILGTIFTQSQAGFTDLGATVNYSPLYQIGAAGNLATTFTDGGQIGRANVSTRTLSAFDILTSQHTGTVITNFVNGQAAAIPFSHTLGTLNISFTRIGARVASAGLASSDWFNGDISEVIVYNRALNANERQDVEYYLTRKWQFLGSSIPRQVYAIQNGLWSNTNTWSVSTEPSPWNFPASADNVYTNSFLVTADINTRVDTIQSSTLAPSILSGGYFQLSSISLTANAIRQSPSSNFATILFCNGNTNATLVGNLSSFGGYVTYALSGTDTCNITINGNIETDGGTGAGLGSPLIHWASRGNLLVNGNLYNTTFATGILNLTSGNITLKGNLNLNRAFTNYSGGTGISNSQNGNIYIFGNIFNENFITGFGTVGIRNLSFGNVYVVGNVNGGRNCSDNVQGITNSTTGSVFITGNVFGGVSPNAPTRSLHGLVNSGRVEVLGNVIGGSMPRGTNYTGGNDTNSGIRLNAVTSSLFVTGSLIANDVNYAVLQDTRDSSYNITGTASTDVINHTSNPMSNNTMVYFTSANNDFELLRPFYVVNRAANTYQLSRTLGGTPIDITTNFSGTLTRSVIVLNADKIESSSFGTPAVYALQYQVTPTTVPSYTRFPVDRFNNFTDFYTSDATFSYPSSADVRQNTTYSNNTLTGSMIVPPASSVYYGVRVDNETGTGYLDYNNIWNVPISNIAESNSIGRRLKSSVTTSQLSAIVDSLNSN